MSDFTKENEDPEALSMFFDREFVPHTYLDALFNSTTKSSSNLNSSQLTSLDNLKSLQGKCTSLLTHLDYYTNELSRDLSTKIESLKASSSIISYSYERDSRSGDPDLNLTGTTRLDYYADLLKNSIHSLHNEVQMVDTQISNLRTQDSGAEQESQRDADADTTIDSLATAKGDPIEKLIKLKQVRINVTQVLKIFETAKIICQTDPSFSKINNEKQAPTGSKSTDEYIVITQTSFTNSLYMLQDTILNQLKSHTGTNQVDKELIDKIDSLVELLPLFKHLGNFYTPYNKFINRIVNEKDIYLSSKKLGI